MIHSLMVKENKLSSGGRGIKSLLETIVERPVKRWVFYKAPKPGTKLHITVSPDGNSILVNGQAVPR
jgi:hypothetical protein